MQEPSPSPGRRATSLGSAGNDNLKDRLPPAVTSIKASQEAARLKAQKEDKDAKALARAERINFRRAMMPAGAVSDPAEMVSDEETTPAVDLTQAVGPTAA